jgi:hypothetical protein
MRQVIEGLKQAAKTTAAAGQALKEGGELLTQQTTAMNQALASATRSSNDNALKRRIDERRIAVTDRSLALSDPQGWQGYDSSLSEPSDPF